MDEPEVQRRRALEDYYRRRVLAGDADRDLASALFNLDQLESALERARLDNVELRRALASSYCQVELWEAEVERLRALLRRAAGEVGPWLAGELALGSPAPGDKVDND